MKRNIFIIIISSIFSLAAFEWSQTPSKITESFAENRGDCFNTGVVYENKGDVSVAEKGTSIINLKEQDSMGWFNSPLGNAVIIVHDNKMMSIYSNLKKDITFSESMHFQTGEIIAKSGDSGWQGENTENCGSGFKVIDTKKQTVVNPMILIEPDTNKERIQIEGVKAITRRGKVVDLYKGVTISSGQYTLYMQRPQNLMIQESQVSLNGVVNEMIYYDSLNQNISKLTIRGNRNYSYAEIYPDSKKMRLAEVLLQKGSNTIEISLSGNNGSKTSIVYRLNVQ